jgi:hypothetical protein
LADGVEDPDMKIHLLLGEEKTVNESLRQALELQAVLLAARLHKTSGWTVWGSLSPPSRRRDKGKEKKKILPTGRFLVLLSVRD